MSEAAAADGAAQEGTPEATQETNPVYDRVDQLAGDLGTFMEEVRGLVQPEAAEPEAEPDPWAALYGEPDPEPDPGPQLDLQQLRDAIRADLRSEMEQEFGPIRAEVDHLRSTHDLNTLYEKHPDLKDPEVKKATGQAVQALAASFEQRYGQGAGQLIANDPEMIALVHQAQAGQRAASAERPATGDPTQLEGGGGAAPGSAEQPSIVARVLADRRSFPKGFR